MSYTCEDLLEILANMQSHNGNFKLESSDVSLIYSLAKQTVQGTGYTDRQHELVKTKLSAYSGQFVENGYENIQDYFDILRLNLRSIDRSKYIKKIDNKLAVRFVFSKKLIARLDEIKRYTKHLEYDKQNKIHYFEYDEKSIYYIVEAFSNGDFEICETVQDDYRKIKNMKNNRKDFVPSLRGLSLFNLNNKAFDYAVSSIGPVSQENFLHYYDRRELIGLADFDEDELYEAIQQVTPLTASILKRDNKNVLVNSKKYSMQQLFESMLELNRFPLMIVLQEKLAYSQLRDTYNLLNGFINKNEISVLFRLDNTQDGIDFNQYIQKHNLNNKVDKTTKVVYISDNKVPKPLLQLDWDPVAAIQFEAGRRSSNNKIMHYLETLDLSISYDSDASPFLIGKIYEA